MRYGDTAGNEGRVEETSDGYEANIPAPQPAKGAEARVSAPDDDAVGPSNPEVAPSARPEAADEGLGPGDERLAKGARLKTGREIQRVFDEGASLRGSRFLLRWACNDAGTVRWAFAVGKKLAPGAVTRNQVRRKMRAAAREVGDRLPEGVDVVLVAGRGALTATVAEMAAEIAALAGRVPSRGSV